MGEAVTLHHPTADVQGAFEWLLRNGFSVIASQGGPLEGNQLVELVHRQTRVWVSRDKGQWMLDLQPAGWLERCQLGQLLAVMRLEHLPIDRRQGSMPVQLPPGESWSERLPEVLVWATDSPHRSVFVDVERQRFGTRNFGGRGGAPDVRRIERWVSELAAAIVAPDRHLPTYGQSEDGARPHIEVTGSRMAFVVVERGREFQRHEFDETIDLLEHIFRGVTFAMGADWELSHRDDSTDIRRRLWAKQLDLLHVLHPLWADRFAESYASKFEEVDLAAADAKAIVRSAEAAAE